MKGACLCGAIRYEIHTPPLNQTVYHCAGCRRAKEDDVTVGTLDDPSAFHPTQDVFPDQRLPWVAPFAPPRR